MAADPVVSPADTPAPPFRLVAKGENTPEERDAARLNRGWRCTLHRMIDPRHWPWCTARPDALERQMTVTICDDCSCQAKKIKGGWSCPCCGDPATVREVTVTALVSLRAAGEGDT